MESREKPSVTIKWEIITRTESFWSLLEGNESRGRDSKKRIVVVHTGKDQSMNLEFEGRK